MLKKQGKAWQMLFLLLLLSHFSCVRLCVTPWTAAHQAPPSRGFSRQEHWSGLPFPSPMYESKSESKVAQSCLTLRNPMDCSPPGSSVHGIFQARVLEWGSIAFSEIVAGALQIQVLLWGIFWKLKKFSIADWSNPWVQIQHPLDHCKSNRVPQKHLLLLHWVCQSLQLCG